jgi:hypothetical protein
MKIVYSILLLLIITSCNEQNKSKNSEQDNQDLTTTSVIQSMSFSEVNSRGILIGEKIVLLDSSLNIISDISDLNESFVEIKAISDSLYKKDEKDDYCEEFRYIKIKSKDFEGLIDGRLIFEPVKSLQNKKYNDIELVTTSYFGIGFSNEDGLTFCSENTPTILINKKSGDETLIRMLKNEYYNSNYDYFQLEASDGGYDEIIEIKEVDGKYQLQIRTEYQEGGALFTVEIRKNDQGDYLAEILNKEELKIE